MSDSKFKNRVSCKRPHPNPVFRECLESLFHDAVKERSHLAASIKEALQSLSKYPLPLKSGAECAILKGFDKGLCRFIDIHLNQVRKLTRFSQIHNVDTYQDQPHSNTDVEIYKTYSHSHVTNMNSSVDAMISDATYKCKSNIDTVSGHGSSNGSSNTLQCSSHTILRGKEDHRRNKSKIQLKGQEKVHSREREIPEYRSGKYAIVMVLMEQELEGNQKVGVTKEELTLRAQKHCNITFCDPKLYLENAESLVSKGLVEVVQCSEIKEELYLLTDRGRTVGAVLLESAQRLYDTPQLSADDNMYDIILLIDKNETGGVNKRNDPTVKLFGRYPGLKHEFRSLKVGDYMWVARCRRTGDEYVLPYIVERKRTDDLAASIKDGRFHEQKFRLRRCGVAHVIYLAERHGARHSGGALAASGALAQALANTGVQERFLVVRSAGLAHSVRLLALLTRRLRRTRPARLTFAQFSEAACKSRALCVRETLVKVLVQARGMSVRRALALCGGARAGAGAGGGARAGAGAGGGARALAAAARGPPAALAEYVGASLARTLHELFTRDEL